MDITLLIMENHGIVLLNFCGNPETVKRLKTKMECGILSLSVCLDKKIQAGAHRLDGPNT